jgi:predicted kinase
MENIMRLHILIGLPGSGKTKIATQLPGFVHSLDDFKKNYPDLSATQLWKRMCKSTEEALNTKSDVVFVAPNLSLHKRKQILKVAKKVGAETTGVLVLAPIENCKENAKGRYSEKQIDRLIKTFKIPEEKEFDKFYIIQNEIGSDEIDFDFSENNGLDAFSLIRHLQLTGDYVDEENEILIEAAKYHDIGKAFIIPHKSKHGRSHFGHENYGALWYLSTRKTGQNELKAAKLINYHTRPYFWENSEKTKLKDIEFFDEEFIKNLEKLHEADIKASI